MPGVFSFLDCPPFLTSDVGRHWGSLPGEPGEQGIRGEGAADRYSLEWVWVEQLVAMCKGGWMDWISIKGRGCGWQLAMQRRRDGPDQYIEVGEWISHQWGVGRMGCWTVPAEHFECSWLLFSPLCWTEEEQLEFSGCQRCRCWCSGDGYCVSYRCCFATGMAKTVARVICILLYYVHLCFFFFQQQYRIFELTFNWYFKYTFY